MRSSGQAPAISASATVSDARRLSAAKPAGEDAAVAGRAGGARDLVERAREGGARALLGHQAKLGRLAGQRPAEGGSVAEHAVEEGTRPAIAIEGSRERLFVAAERGCRREPRVTTRARAFARDRLGANRIDGQEGQSRHRSPIVLQGWLRGRGKGGQGGALTAVSGSST